MLRTHPSVLRGRLRPLVAILFALLALPLVAATALAHNPEIQASVDCSGTVTFVSTAWEGTHGSDQDASRTNSKIQISWSADGGATWTTLPDNAAYHYDADNGYSFTDSFASGGAASVIVKAVAVAPWGNGYVSVHPEDDRQTDPIYPPKDCATPTPTPTATPTTTPTGGVGGETGTPGVTPPSTSTIAGTTGSGDGFRVILLVLAGIAVLSLVLLPSGRESKRR